MIRLFLPGDGNEAHVQGAVAGAMHPSMNDQITVPFDSAASLSSQPSGPSPKPRKLQPCVRALLVVKSRSRDTSIRTSCPVALVRQLKQSAYTLRTSIASEPEPQLCPVRHRIGRRASRSSMLGAKMSEWTPAVEFPSPNHSQWPHPDATCWIGGDSPGSVSCAAAEPVAAELARR